MSLHPIMKVLYMYCAFVSAHIFHRNRPSLETCSNEGANWGQLNIARRNLYLSSPYQASPFPYERIFLPVYATHPLYTHNQTIAHVVIIFHGLFANADFYFCLGLQSALEVSRNYDVMIIAPELGYDRYLGSEWEISGSSSDSSIWFNNTNCWMQGCNSSPMPYNYTSSFDAVDELINLVSQPELYPNLKRITLAGFSAGAQFLNRYAWASSRGVQPSIIRYVLGDAGTYLYLTPSRPALECRPPHNTGPSLTCASFKPPPASGPGSCNGHWDDWPYGLSMLPIDDHVYFQKFRDIANTAGLSINQAKLAEHTARFFEKDTRYILGEADSCQCNVPGFVNDPWCFVAPESGVECVSATENYGSRCCDTYPDGNVNYVSYTCGSLLQGSNRLQRGLLYRESFRLIKADYKDAFETIPEMNHDASKFFRSAEFKEWAFGQSGKVYETSFTIARQTFRMHFPFIVLSTVLVMIVLLRGIYNVFCRLLSRHYRSFDDEERNNVKLGDITEDTQWLFSGEPYQAQFR